MVGSARVEAGMAAVLGRDAILATKVTIPPVRSGSLDRSRLVRALDEAVGRKLTLVCAPAGFGKTTLLADWAQRTSLPVAWVSLDVDDSDPARFWRYLAAALERARTPLGDPAASPLGSAVGASSEGMAAAVIQEVEDPRDDLVVVLDDYHTVNAEAVHDGMSYLLSHQPAHLHVVVSSRADPPLPVARLRASDQLAELRAADLRFTAEEGTAFLERVWGLDIAPQIAAALHARTEGWVAGLQLAALSLKDRSDRDAFVDAFAGTNRYVLDYLSEEVLAFQPEDVQGFLLQTSVLERLCGPLCDAVTGGGDGQQRLEELDRANLFIVQLDEERRWYRYHPLFADLLRARLQQTAPGSVLELHHRAAVWCAEHELIDLAIRHAVSAAETAWAADLAVRNLNDAFSRGEVATVVRWLSVLPEELVRSRPRLCVARAMVAWHRYRLDEMERALEPVDAALAAQDEETRQLPFPTEGGLVSDGRAAVSLLRAQSVLVSGDTAKGREHLQAALSRIDDNEAGPRFWASWLVNGADWIDGRMAAAETRFAEMLATGRASPDPHPLMIACTALGQVQEARGTLGAALRTYEDGLRFARESERFSPFHIGEAHLGIARVLYERNELERALHHAAEGVRLSRQTVEYLLLGIGLQTLAWIRQAMSDGKGATDAMDESGRLIPSPNRAAWIYAGDAGRVKLLLTQGRVQDVERWASERGLGADDDVSYPSERSHLVLARLLLAAGQPDGAGALLERLDDLADAQGRTGSLIEIRALRALALDAAGDRGGALALLARVLARARPEGYVRAFVDEGAPMARLLHGLASVGPDRPALSGADRSHLNRLLRAFEPGGTQGDEGGVPTGGLIEPLTDREFEVLRLVAEGRRNQEIAEDLFVTVDTVKKHMSHILDKLAVSNRTEAVAEARAIGVLGPTD